MAHISHSVQMSGDNQWRNYRNRLLSKIIILLFAMEGELLPRQKKKQNCH